MARPVVFAIVTKGSDDGTFLLGDHLTFMSDGTVLCKEAGGWLTAKDVQEGMFGLALKKDEHKLTMVAEGFRSLKAGMSGVAWG